MSLSEPPILKKLFFVESVPVEYSMESSTRELALYYTRVDIHGHAKIPILSMEVRRTVIVIEHVDHDPEESRYLRHPHLSLILALPTVEARNKLNPVRLLYPSHPHAATQILRTPRSECEIERTTFIP
jgi:hypothetical protein